MSENRCARCAPARSPRDAPPTRTAWCRPGSPACPRRAERLEHRERPDRSCGCCSCRCSAGCCSSTTARTPRYRWLAVGVFARRDDHRPDRRRPRPQPRPRHRLRQGRRPDRRQGADDDGAGRPVDDRRGLPWWVTDRRARARVGHHGGALLGDPARRDGRQPWRQGQDRCCRPSASACSSSRAGPCPCRGPVGRGSRAITLGAAVVVDRGRPASTTCTRRCGCARPASGRCASALSGPSGAAAARQRRSGSWRAEQPGGPHAVVALLRGSTCRIGTAESLTGGLVCARTDRASPAPPPSCAAASWPTQRGQGVVLGVDRDLLAREGAVCEPVVAQQMADGDAAAVLGCDRGRVHDRGGRARPGRRAAGGHACSWAWRALGRSASELDLGVDRRWRSAAQRCSPCCGCWERSTGRAGRS